VFKFQQDLDEAIDKFEEEQMDKEAELNNLLELINQTRIKDNKAKLQLFVKRMLNSKKYLIWRGWTTFHQRKKEARRLAELEALAEAERLKLARMKDSETNAMLKMFMKRWQNLKIAVPFSTWSDLTKANRESNRLSALEEERRRLMPAMASMADSDAAQRLKMYFQKMRGANSRLIFNALKRHSDKQKLLRMGDDERFNRLKRCLEQKLLGIKYAVFNGFKREARDQKALRLKNCGMAQKLAAFLELKLKGMNFAIMSALKRNAANQRAARAEQERMSHLFDASNNEALKRLNVYLQGNEFTMKHSAFRWWQKCTTGSGLGKLQRELNEKRRRRQAMEDQLAALESQLSGGNAEDVERAIAMKERDVNAARNATSRLLEEAEMAKQRLLDAQLRVENEKNMHKENKGVIAALEAEIEKAQHHKDLLAHEVNHIFQQIGALSGDISADRLRR